LTACHNNNTQVFTFITGRNTKDKIFSSIWQQKHFGPLPTSWQANTTPESFPLIYRINGTVWKRHMATNKLDRKELIIHSYCTLVIPLHAYHLSQSQTTKIVTLSPQQEYGLPSFELMCNLKIGESNHVILCPLEQSVKE